MAVAVAGGIFARRARLLVRIMRLGKPAPRFDDVPQRVRQEAVVAIGQRKLLQRLGPGVMHALIFWGFLVLFPTIVMALVSAVNRDWSIPWLGAQGWFMALVDLFVLSVLVGIAMAFWIRRGLMECLPFTRCACPV